jgi:hypothetical protein
MMRPIMGAAIVLVAIISFGLYELKIEVRGLESELSGLRTGITAEKENIRVLNAEWSYLNRPERLGNMAARHLELAPIVSTQFIDAAMIPMRPPPYVPDVASLIPMDDGLGGAMVKPRFVGGVFLPQKNPRTTIRSAGEVPQ